MKTASQTVGGGVILYFSQGKISASQLVVLMFGTIVGQSFLILPKGLAESAGRDGWASIILAALIVMGLVVLAIWLGRRYPDLTAAEYSIEILGKPLGYCVNLAFALYLLIAAGWVIRAFGDSLKLFLLDRTPLEVIIISFLLVSAYLVLHGLEALCRIAEVFFPFIIFPLAIIWLVGMMAMDFKEICPIFANGFKPVLEGTVTAYGGFAGFSIVIFLLPYLRDKKKESLGSLIAIFLVMIVYLLGFIGALAMFGETELTYLNYPSIDLARNIEIPGSFVERFETIFLSLWILSIYLSVTSVYYFSLLTVAITFKLKEPRCLTYIYAPIILFIALLPDNFAAVEKLGDLLGLMSASLAVLLPVMLFISFLRKGRMASSE